MNPAAVARAMSGGTAEAEDHLLRHELDAAAYAVAEGRYRTNGGPPLTSRPAKDRVRSACSRTPSFLRTVSS
ncbi:hypothetical protein GCM10018987_54100 [Streptomyces cremeus]